MRALARENVLVAIPAPLLHIIHMQLVVGSPDDYSTCS